MTKIAWTNKTWNFIVGCSIVSEGCHNCYAMKMSDKLARMGQEKYYGLTKLVDGKPYWSGVVRVAWEFMDRPYKWKKPARIFVNSMSDLFHPSISDDVLDKAFTVMRETPQHTYQVLTKRPERMVSYFSDRQVPPNVWLGTSVENDRTAQERIPLLGQLPSGTTTFLSYEPALGPIDWKDEWTWINQIIIGAESGDGRRYFDMEWARKTRDFCVKNDIAFFFKQGPAFKSGQSPYLIEKNGECWLWHQYPDDRADPVQIPEWMRAQGNAAK